MDPVLATGETRKIQADLASADAVMDRWGRSTARVTALTENDVREVIADAGGIIGLLATAERTERVDLYRALGLTLRYEKQTTGQERVHARLLTNC